MKSKRALAAITNGVLACIVIVVAAVCFLPAARTASAPEERVFRRGNSTDGVSLMFNVYWGTAEVYEILDVLQTYGATATFFVGGCWADDNISCLKEISEGGHEIGSHGYFHLNHDMLDYSANVREIGASLEFLSLALHAPVTLFAPPSGAYSEDTVAAAESLGLKTILWSRDTIDWRDKDADLCFSRATDVQAGDFVLMHPMAHTARALPRILEAYRERGIRTVTVSENLG